MEPAVSSSSLLATNHVTVSALHGGSLTLPEYLFVQPSSVGKRLNVPSLSFLIQHRDSSSGVLTRIVFDLGLRLDLTRYPAVLQQHLTTREPFSTFPDVKESLRRGGLSPLDIDVVMLSHVHWDHVGTPWDFTESCFVVGPGSLELLEKGSDTSTTGGHSHFESDLLPINRTVELLPTYASSMDKEPKTGMPPLLQDLQDCRWISLYHLPHVIDVFSDQSLYIVDAPGHLQGHINLLAKTGPGKWVYLGGDACHDRRLLSGEREIAQWMGPGRQLCCIHVDRDQTAATLEKIRLLGELEDEYVEIILAHDAKWATDSGNQSRFWPGHL